MNTAGLRNFNLFEFRSKIKIKLIKTSSGPKTHLFTVQIADIHAIRIKYTTLTHDPTNLCIVLYKS